MWQYFVNLEIMEIKISIFCHMKSAPNFHVKDWETRKCITVHLHVPQ